MPYKTGVLLEAGNTNIDLNTIKQIRNVFCPIMSEFFAEEIEGNISATTEAIIFETPLNMPIILDKAHSDQMFRYFFHLTNSTANSFWGIQDVSYGSALNSDFPLMYHVAINKNNTIMSLGVGFQSIGEPFFTVTVVKTGDSYIAIQHGVTDRRANVDKAWVKDAYHKSESNYKMMSARASGGYYSDSKLVLVPAIDPWTGDVIPDLYLSLLRPIDTRSVRNLISINGRQFISGVVTDGGGNAYIQAMPMFIEI